MRIRLLVKNDSALEGVDKWERERERGKNEKPTWTKKANTPGSQGHVSNQCGLGLF